MCWIVFLVYASIEVTGGLLESGKCGKDFPAQLDCEM